MPVFTFTLKDYLVKERRLNTATIAIGGEARSVPTDAELAKAVGMEPTPFSRMVNNRTDGLSRKKVALLITELRKRGFYPSVSDLFSYQEQ